MMKQLIKWINLKIEKYLQIDAYERKKLLLLSFSFFFIIGSYSILRSLKTSIFLGLVGKEYQPYTRLITIIIMVPCMVFYSKLVDKLKRYQLVYTILGIYAVLTLVFALLLAHPVYGLRNTLTSPYRFLGWAFEIFMDLYSALVVSTFWGFVNSVCTPDYANKNYGFIVAISRLGGVLTPLIGLFLTSGTSLAHWQSIPLITLGASLLLLVAIFLILRIIQNVPASYLRGYEAAYTPEQQQDSGDNKKPKKKPGALEGLKIMLVEPYVLGIFGLVYSIEIISIIFDYQMQVLLSIETNNHIGAMSSFMFIYTASFQALGFLFAFFGASTLLKTLGIRSCLMIMPFATIVLTISLLALPSLGTIFIIMVILRALHYGFNYPVREILYIPTVKDIQFKSKAWIESFGKTFSKASGATFNLLSIAQNPYMCLQLNSAFSLAIGSIYIAISFFIGRTYVKTIKENKVIGKK